MIETADLLRFVSALALVIGLIVVMVWTMRRLGMGGAGGGAGRRRRRLALVETLALDGRHRLVLVRCDSREHLLLLGQAHDLVVDSDLPPPPRFEPIPPRLPELPL
jgi:flagellar protein FliO/FliZ